MNKRFLIYGSIFMILGIAAGALGAHALKEVLSAKSLASFETGVRYMIYHGLALLILGVAAEKFTNLKWVGRFLIVGVVLFSGSIFLLSTQSLMGIGLKFLGPVTPLGGLLMIAGWSLLLKNLLLPEK